MIVSSYRRMNTTRRRTQDWDLIPPTQRPQSQYSKPSNPSWPTPRSTLLIRQDALPALPLPRLRIVCASLIGIYPPTPTIPAPLNPGLSSTSTYPSSTRRRSCHHCALVPPLRLAPLPSLAPSRKESFDAEPCESKKLLSRLVAVMSRPRRFNWSQHTTFEGPNKL